MVRFDVQPLNARFSRRVNCEFTNASPPWLLHLILVRCEGEPRIETLNVLLKIIDSDKEILLRRMEITKQLRLGLEES